MKAVAHKKLKRAGRSAMVIFLVILYVLTSVSTFMVSTAQVQAADANFNWRASDNSTTNSRNFADGRFTFITPGRIQDTVTETVYISNNSNIWNNGGSEYPRNGGWFYHWPSGKVRGETSGGECIDPLAVRVSQPDDELEVYAIDVKDVGGNCIVEGLNNGDYDGSNEDKDPPDASESKISYSFTESTARFSIALWRWENSNNLQGYGTAKDLSKVEEPYLSILNDLIDDELDFNPDDYDYYNHSDCNQDNEFVQAFVGVNKAADAKAKAFIYYDDGTDGNKGTLEYGWRGDNLGCLIGENYTKNPANFSLIRSDVGVSGASASWGRIYLASPQNATTEGDPPGDGGEDGEPGDVGESPSCEGGSLDWVICPITNGVASLADGIVANFLQPVLRAQILELPGASDPNSQALYGVWKSFRNLANATLILAFLIIIVSSAMSSE